METVQWTADTAVLRRPAAGTTARECGDRSGPVAGVRTEVRPDVCACTENGSSAADAPTATTESTRPRRAIVTSLPAGLRPPDPLRAAYPMTVNTTSRDTDRRDNKSVTVIPSRYSPASKLANGIP